MAAKTRIGEKGPLHSDARGERRGVTATEAATAPPATLASHPTRNRSEDAGERTGPSCRGEELSETSSTSFVSNGNVRRLCVLLANAGVISETFIRAHVARLPARVTAVHGLVAGGVPSIRGEPVLSQSVAGRASRKLLRAVSGRPWEWEVTRSLLKAFARRRPDAVLAEYGTTGVLALEACRKLNLPLVVHFHGYDASAREVLESHARSYVTMFEQSAAVIAVSRAMQRQLIALGAPACKVHYNPYGVDCHDFGGADPASASPVFLSVGRFVEKKAPFLTLMAFVTLFRTNPDARLRMIGDGPLLGPCRAMARALGVEAAVTFLGAQPEAVVQNEMRATRAFVQHSIEASNGDCEGTPVGIIEAGASGLPVIATRHGGIPDVVIEGETGLLVDEVDVVGMACHMRRLAEESEYAGRLGLAARAHVCRHFSMEHSISRLWNIIERCIRP